MTDTIPASDPIDDSLPCIRSELTVRLLEDEAIVFDPRSHTTHRLNATALTIWWLCAGADSVRQVAARVAEVYDVSLDRAAADVTGIVAKLNDLDLVDGPLLPA